MFHPNGPSFRELVRQALSSTEKGYDLLAPKFDVTPFRTPDPILEGTARYLRGGRFARALDLCCGTGAGASILHPLATDLVVGLDFSSGMLRVARQSGSGAAFVRADALRSPFEQTFDLVTCFSALGHFLPSQHVALVRAVRDSLVPGGRFVFVTGRMPRVASTTYWISRGFNAAMRVRNSLWSPAFVMYYLTFLLPAAATLLEREGFRVDVVEGWFPEPFAGFVLVDARRDALAG
jgi:SAM-dependent methyltransferase